MKRIGMFVVVAAMMFSGCATNQTILVSNKEKNEKLSIRKTVRVTFTNPYDLDFHGRLKAYDAVYHKTWWMYRLLIPAKKTVTMNLYPAVNYGFAGTLHQNNKPAGSFNIRFSTTDIDNQKVALTLDNKIQLGVIVNNSSYIVEFRSPVEFKERQVLPNSRAEGITAPVGSKVPFRVRYRKPDETEWKAKTFTQDINATKHDNPLVEVGGSTVFVDWYIAFDDEFFE